MNTRRIVGAGCLSVALLFLAAGIVGYMRFTNASSRQPVGECLRKMKEPILSKYQLISDANLNKPTSVIQHVIYGNEDDALRLAERLTLKGWKASVEPQDEIGWATILEERPTEFGKMPAERIRQMCNLAQSNRMEYRSWWLVAPGSGATTHVSQSGDAVVIGNR